MDKEKPVVIVLSRNYSTGLGVIRSLGAVGYTVDLIASTKKKGSSIIASSSKYVRRSVEVISTKIQGDSGEGIVDALMEYAKDSKEKMILFPTDDFTVSVVDLHREKLKEYFYMPQIVADSKQSIVEIMDKVVQGEAARKAGLLTPLEWVIPLDGVICVPKDMIYPCYLKPLQSVSGQKSEMAVCKNETELKRCLDKMKEFYADRSVLVQEYLYIDKEYDLSGVCLDQQVIIPGVIEKTRIARHECGVTMSGKMLSTDVLGESFDKINELMKSFHYVGMFDLELNVCGDNIYFNEVNFRSGGPNYFYFLNGVNLPAAFVKGITGEVQEAEEIDVFGKTFVYEKVAWEDYIYSYMTRKELIECIKSADYTLLSNEDDFKPGDHFEKRIRLSMIKQKVKRFCLGRMKT